MSERVLKLIAEVQNAYDCATSVYARLLNQLFANAKLDVRLDCDKHPKASFGEARQNLESALMQLHPFVPKMPLPRMMPLWSIAGYPVSLYDDMASLLDNTVRLEKKWTDRKATKVITEPFLASVRETNRRFRDLRSQVRNERKKRRTTIPLAKRTRPMSYKRAAKLMGKGDSKDAAEWLSKSVSDGSIPCERITRQNHVFSCESFPESAQKFIR